MLELPACAERLAATVDLGLTDRTNLAAGDFFQPYAHIADTVVADQGLNDLPDIHAIRILRRCADATRNTDGTPDRVVIIERLPSGVDEGDHLDMSLLMLVLSRPRSAHWISTAHLATEAEMTVVEPRNTGHDMAVKRRPTTSQISHATGVVMCAQVCTSEQSEISLT